MLPDLLTPLAGEYQLFNLFRYITFRTGGATCAPPSSASSSKAGTAAAPAKSAKYWSMAADALKAGRAPKGGREGARRAPLAHPTEAPPGAAEQSYCGAHVCLPTHTVARVRHSRGLLCPSHAC